jgi:hypothetical protein
MSPKRSPTPDENDERIVNTHLDENEQKVLNAHLDEILAEVIPARRAADVQDGRSTDLGDDPPSDAPVPPTDAPDIPAAPSAGIEDRDRRAAQEKLNALAMNPPSLQISDIAKKLLFRGT